MGGKKSPHSDVTRGQEYHNLPLFEVDRYKQRARSVWFASEHVLLEFRLFRFFCNVEKVVLH
jgi:hypothetical protein